MSPQKVLVDLSKVDWELLREQKLDLTQMFSDLAAKSPSLVELRERLDGVLSLLDDIQDQAAEVLGEDVVFGPPEDEA